MLFSLLQGSRVEGEEGLLPDGGSEHGAVRGC